MVSNLSLNLHIHIILGRELKGPTQGRTYRIPRKDPGTRWRVLGAKSHFPVCQIFRSTCCTEHLRKNCFFVNFEKSYRAGFSKTTSGQLPVTYISECFVQTHRAKFPLRFYSNNIRVKCHYIANSHTLGDAYFYITRK